MTRTRLKSTVRWLATGALIALFTAVVVFAAAWYLSPFPEHRLQRFSPNPVVTDAHGRRLLSVVSPDEQWSMPVPLDAMSPRLIQATIAVEDERFYGHCGVDVLAVARAAVQNIVRGRVVSGASTITMQVCRMMDDRPRTLTAKVIESFRALQLSRLRTKNEVLEIYLNTAPYGGNIRGVEAASLMYFSKHAADLSLAEAALLAGLPKSPTRCNPRTHLDTALKRQRTVLARMQQAGMITPEECRMAAETPLVINDLPLGRHAPHAAWMALKQRPLGGRTWIDLSLQQQIESLAQQHLKTLPDGTEIAIVVINIEQSAIVTLVGSGDPSDPVDGQVNGALARRSPGSALKPFIYAAAFEAGRLAPESIVYDVPVNFAGWRPDNFDRTFRREVTAADALRQSLNSPALQIARAVGVGRCCGILRQAGISLPDDVVSRTGLAVAVGGAEVSLLELADAYAALGRGGLYRKARLFVDEPASASGRPALDSNVCRTLDHILSSRARRPNGMADFAPADVPWFMWKTGTSAARRDAWALGHNRRWAVGVWVGRFRGTGRFQYVGALAAEPLLARIFALPALRFEPLVTPADPILVHRPLPLPASASPDLHIVSPADGDIFLSSGGQPVPIVLAVNTNDKHDELTWFLNGKLLRPQAAHQSIPVVPGRYTLRCLNKAGASSAVNFEVR
ncbi:MAG TPA: penicillin-binding protein 1C [Anaerohalosphaeraceae bacterium]|jgi:penicillin-binding protein 1C|nr:penicillin-binding protein 1C [Anaerohalosphaeraceae bacterium]HRT50385.1 penicillin-binding protein 1C [Anaerohalosphaeraceae bacterium]HRT86316.1 penicillin-binding protein 1C [Anaerohalosphaeraceae bacterium]